MVEVHIESYIKSFLRFLALFFFLADFFLGLALPDSLQDFCAEGDFIGSSGEFANKPWFVLKLLLLDSYYLSTVVISDGLLAL